VPTRVTSVHDEAETFGCRSERRSRFGLDVYDEKHASRRGADSLRSGVLGGIGQSFQHHGVRMAQDQTDAERNTSGPQPMDADPFGRGAGAWSWYVGHRSGRDSAEHVQSLFVDHFAGACEGASRCDRFEQPDNDFDYMLGGNDADGRRSVAVAAEQHMKPSAFRQPFGPNSHVGGKGVEMQGTASVDDNGNFRSERVREGGSRKRPSQHRRQPACIDDLVRIQSGQRIHDHGNSAGPDQIECRNSGSESGRRHRSKSADLDAATRRDLDDSVPVPA
jgi:hypothetical protein